MKSWMRKFFLSLVIHLSCFQMAFGEVYAAIAPLRAPASFTHEISLKDLNKELESFKNKMAGFEDESHCLKDEEEAEESNLDDEVDEEYIEEDEFNIISSTKDDPFYKYLENLEKNACGEHTFTWDKETPIEETKDCQPKKVEGYIDEVIAKVMKVEADDKEPEPFRLDDPVVRKHHKKAIELQQQVRQYLSDRDVEEDHRRDLLVKYIESVILPMRDLIVVMRAYIPHEYDGIYFYESLLVEFPTSLYPEDEKDLRDLITLGPNPSVNPFYMQIVDKRWGRSQIRFKPSEVLARDMLTIVKAPTHKNYIRAMKWMTLQMMLQQVFIYDSMLGNTAPISIPRSCQNHFNGDLPDSFQMQFTAAKGEEFMDGILTKQGMLFTMGDHKFMEYYMDNVNRDPLQEGYSGMMPFEEYKAAMVGLDKEAKKKFEPDMDDETYFDMVQRMKSQKVNEVFHDSTSSLLGLRDSKSYTYRGAKLFEKFLAIPGENDVYEITLEDEEVIEIDHVAQNLSVYLAETLQRNGLEHFEELITPRMETQLKETEVKIDFPSIYGAVAWRQWALAALNTWVEDKEANGLSATTERHLKRACGTNTRGRTLKTGICNASSGKGILANMKSYFKSVQVTDGYIPTRRLNEEKHIHNFQILKKVWNNLRDWTDELPVAKPSEYDLLIAQMNNLNPWARLRFSYLVAMEELTSFKEGMMPKFRARAGRSPRYRQSQCFYRNINSLMAKVKKAGKEMGIDQPLNVHHANKILEDEEKEGIWDDKVSNGSPLFKVKLGRSGHESYKYLEEVSYKTFLDKDSIEEFVNKTLPGGDIRDKSWDMIDKVLASPEGKRGTFFLDLYKAKGDPEKQLELFEEFSQDNGIDNAFMAKMNFLILDNALKRPIYMSLIQDAALKRKLKMQNKLQEFCDLEPNDHESMQALFHSTSKAQNKLNELAGAPVVPDDVLKKITDKVNDMSPSEKSDIWLGLGAGFLGVGAILIGGMCTGVTGGLCAPLGVAMMTAGASAMGMQMTLVKREVKRKFRADEFEKKVKDMEDLGFASRGSSDNVSRGWFWAAFETISIIPLIGVTVRSLKVGAKLTTVSTAMMLRNTGKVGFKQAWRMTGQAGKTVVSEADTAFARTVLGFESLGKQSKAMMSSVAKYGGKYGSKLVNAMKNVTNPKVVKEGMEKIRKIQLLYRQGKISATTMAKRISQVITGVKASSKPVMYTSNVVVKETPELINKRTAKVVSKYFGGNPKEFQYIMSTYVKKLDKAAKTMAKIEGKTSRVGKIPVLGKVVNWYRKMRLEHLNKYAEKILKMNDDLIKLSKTGGDLEKFVLKNMDDLTDIFIKIPVRRRELPYMFLLQGGPHVGGIWFGRRIKYVYGMADGLMLRKFFNARSRLIYESLKSEARMSLGLGKAVAAETSVQAFRAFQESIAESIESVSETEGKAILRQYKDMEEAIAERVFKAVKADVNQEGKLATLKRKVFKDTHSKKITFSQLDQPTMKKILFNPKNKEEQILGEVIWDSVPVDEVFELKEVGDVAYRVMKELAQYENVGEFQRFVNALKVLVIQRDPGVVEIM